MLYRPIELASHIIGLRPMAVYISIFSDHRSEISTQIVPRENGYCHSSRQGGEFGMPAAGKSLVRNRQLQHTRRRTGPLVSPPVKTLRQSGFSLSVSTFLCILTDLWHSFFVI